MDDEQICSALSLLNACHAAFEDRNTEDELPSVVNLQNRDEFVTRYYRQKLLLTKQPYLDQLVTGLIHYGLSAEINVCGYFSTNHGHI